MLWAALVGMGRDTTAFLVMTTNRDLPRTLISGSKVNVQVLLKKKPGAI